MNTNRQFKFILSKHSNVSMPVELMTPALTLKRALIEDVKILALSLGLVDAMLNVDLKIIEQFAVVQLIIKERLAHSVNERIFWLPQTVLLTMNVNLVLFVKKGFVLKAAEMMIIVRQ